MGSDTAGDDLVTHGICPVCADQFFPDEAVPLQRLLDRLDVPVLVVDSEVTVALLNARAQAILGISSEQAAHRRPGEVFDCAHAHLPEGCGRTIHCAGCALRRAIATTFETGDPQVQVPATLKKGDLDDPSAVALRITTIKQGDVVMVKLDKVD